MQDEQIIGLEVAFKLQGPFRASGAVVADIGGYDFEIIHRAGRSHQNADSLSRRPCPQCGMEGLTPVTRKAHQEEVKGQCLHWMALHETRIRHLLAVTRLRSQGLTCVSLVYCK